MSQYQHALCFKILFLLWVSVSSGGAWAADTLILDDQQEINLTPYVRVFEDTKGSASIDELSGSSSASRFRPVRFDKLTLLNPNASYWVKITLQPGSGSLEEKKWVLHFDQQPSVESVVFYESQPEGGYRRVVTGQNHLYSSRDIDSLTFAFDVTIRPQEEKTLFLKFSQTSVGRGIPLTLKSEQRFKEFDRFSWMVIAGYYAILAAIFLYNLLLQLKLKAKSHFYYLLYLSIFAISMSSIDGTASLLIEKGLPDFLFVEDEAYVLLMLVTQVVFVCSLLDVRANIPLARKISIPIIIFIAVSGLLFALLGRISLTVQLLAVSMALTWLFLLILTTVAFLKKIPGAKYLFFAELSMISGYVIATQAYYGVLPANDFISYMPAKVGNVFQLIFFSMVLGDKVSDALQQSFENERKVIVAQAAAEAAERLSHEDPLTALYNRRALYLFGAQALEEAHRYKRPCGVLMLDIDYFKQVNDNYGHAAGDMTINEIAGLCRSIARSTDIVGRIGGEEFAMILPNTDLEGTQTLAERIREGTERLRMKANDAEFQVTVSIGATQVDGTTHSVDRLIDRADKAMYSAKNHGRNQVVTLI